MKTIVAPEVDMLAVSRSSNNQRKSILSFAPRIGLAVVDYGRLEYIDNFYMNCQRFRDYYRDPYNKLPRPGMFRKECGKYDPRHRDKCLDVFITPTRWVSESKPVIYPLVYERQLQLDGGIQLRGLYDATSCIKYKR